MTAQPTIFEQITINVTTIKNISEKIEMLARQAEHMLDQNVTHTEVVLEEVPVNASRPTVVPLFRNGAPISKDDQAIGYAKYYQSAEDVPDISVIGVIVPVSTALKVIDLIITASKAEIATLEAENVKLLQGYPK